MIRQAQMLKELGVKSTKALPGALVDAAHDPQEGLPAIATGVEAPAEAPSLFDEVDSELPQA